MMKTTFFKYGFLTVKCHKKRGKTPSTWRKGQGQDSAKNQGGEMVPVFWQFSFFRGLILYGIYSKNRVWQKLWDNLRKEPEWLPSVPCFPSHFPSRVEAEPGRQEAAGGGGYSSAGRS